MKAFARLTLLILLFRTSALSQSSPPAGSTTTTATSTNAGITTTVTNTNSNVITTFPTSPATSTNANIITTVNNTNSNLTTTSPTTTTTNTNANITTTVNNTNSNLTTTSPTTTATNTNANITTNSTSVTNTNPSVSSTKYESTTTMSMAVTNTTISSANVSSQTTQSSNESSPDPDTTGPCREDSCKDGASCVSLNKAYFCLCIDGYYYDSSKCNQGKIFPGTITVSVSDSDIPALENEKSVSYEKLHMKVTEFFKNVFINSTYGQTVIHKVRISSSARSEVRADGKADVHVTVVSLFPENTTETEMSVSSAIDKAIKANSDDITRYTTQDRCDFYGCVKTDEKDDCSNGLLCKCKPGLERPNPQTPLCVALSLTCHNTCNKEHNMQCLVKNAGNTDCICLPGYQKDDQGNCQPCAFGYNGVDCKDKFQLILTIVGTIAGILILGVVITGILARSKKNNRNIEEQNLIENDFQNLQLQHTADFNNPATAGSIFPKVRATIPRDIQPHNPYANQGGLPRSDY